MRSRWSAEVLLPEANVVAYQLIFEAETWLRRLVLASLLLAHGPDWARQLDPSLRGRLQRQSDQSKSRWYLGVDAEEELLWSTTLGQLAQLLELSASVGKLEYLCDTPASVLGARVRSIGEVRNALAHNRAISDDTLSVLGGDLVVIRAAVARFKARTLYADSDILMTGDDAPEDLIEVCRQFEKVQAEAYLNDRQQLFMSCNNDWIFLVRLPVPPFGVWPRAERIRASLRPLSHMILCVLANKLGDEVQVVMPRTLSTSRQAEVVAKFQTLLKTDHWTQQPPTDQHPAHSTWPRMWFYENEYPKMA